MKVFYETYYKGPLDPKFEPEHNLEYEYFLSCYDFENEVKYMAEDFFHNHDGWECSWPLNFRVWKENGELIGDFKVEMEAVPEFYVIRITNEPRKNNS